MQSQMIGMQSSLDRILAAVQAQAMPPPGAFPPTPRSENGSYSASGVRPPPGVYDPALMQDDRPGSARQFPPLPGFAPPVSNNYHHIALG